MQEHQIICKNYMQKIICKNVLLFKLYNMLVADVGG